ncbi:MAG TPA: diguanylate cyclase [Luteimonas sp.]|nr:diguanylate cyclase [Luteimonas sp.]
MTAAASAPTPPRPPKLLIVDDIPANLVAMRRLLAKVDAEVLEADSGNAALAACLDHEFALILLDVNMPGMDGFEVAQLLAENDNARGTPIIFVTAAYANDVQRLRGYDSGAVDYIEKPINEPILLSKVRVFLELCRSKAQLKSALEELSQQNARLQVEIAERHRAEARVMHTALHDPLTGLPNRLLFMNRLDTAIARAARKQGSFALAYLDIDGFKPVNDTYGHQVGDQLLVEIAKRLTGRVRGADTIARLGGDEFGLILEELADADLALRLAQALVSCLQAPFVLHGDDGDINIEITASVGLAIYPDNADKADALIRAADEAMYQVKRGGRNGCCLVQTVPQA